MTQTWRNNEQTSLRFPSAASLRSRWACGCSPRRRAKILHGWNCVLVFAYPWFSSTLPPSFKDGRDPTPSFAPEAVLDLHHRVLFAFACGCSSCSFIQNSGLHGAESSPCSAARPCRPPVTGLGLLAPSSCPAKAHIPMAARCLGTQRLRLTSDRRPRLRPHSFWGSRLRLQTSGLREEELDRRITLNLELLAEGLACTLCGEGCKRRGAFAVEKAPSRSDSYGSRHASCIGS